MGATRHGRRAVASVMGALRLARLGLLSLRHGSSFREPPKSPFQKTVHRGRSRQSIPRLITRTAEVGNFLLPVSRKLQLPLTGSCAGRRACSTKCRAVAGVPARRIRLQQHGSEAIQAGGTNSSDQSASSLAALGWSEFFHEQLEPGESGLAPMRIVTVHRDRVTAVSELGPVRLNLSAK